MEKQFTDWKKASYLTERRLPTEVPERIGNELVHAWRLRTGLTKEEIYFRRLQEDGFDHKEFANLLGAGDAHELREPMPWTKTFEEIFVPHSSEHEEIPEAESFQHAPFFSITLPFLCWAKSQLLSRWTKWQECVETIPIDKEPILRTYLHALANRLVETSGRALVSELHQAREAGQLTGDTPEERFRDFVRSRIAGHAAIQKTLEKMPVLARLLTEITMKKLQTTIELLERFLHDKSELEKKWQTNLSKLTHISFQAGDSHRGGRSVAILDFQSGARLVYKPRSLAMDQRFQDFLAWLNQRGANPPLPIINVLDQGDYGWCEYIGAASCEEEDQIKRFYQRHGVYLAILSLLHAADFHHGNVLACGEYPYLIDLEALFYRYLPEEKIRTAQQKASHEILHSVLRTGLLPASRFKSGLFQGVEISGIGAREGQVLQQEVYQYEHVGTDRMMLVKKQVPLRSGSNRPRLAGVEVRAEEYTEEIVSGFAAMYQLILQHREELLAHDSPLSRFRGVEARVLVRSTQVYGKMLEASLHPSNLTDGLSRVQLFDFLWRLVETQPMVMPLIASECKDLLEHDVPYFTTKVDSRDMWDSRGKRFANYWPTDCFSLVRDRLEALNREDCEKQIRYIRMSMLTLDRSWELRLADRAVYQEEVEPTKHSPLLFQQAAVRIAEQLAEKAIWGDDGSTVTWLGTGVDEFGQLQFSPMDFGIYDGTLGLALYYAYLAKETGKEKYETIARAAVHSSMEWLKQPATIQSGSLFYGYAAYCFAYLHLARLWGEPIWYSRALDLLPQVERMRQQDRKGDLMAGSAGMLVASLRLYEATGDPEALRLACRCADQLLMQAVTLPEGIGWPTDLTKGKPLAGLSHGASGYALALAGLANASGEERYLEAAKKAIRYERTLFSAEHGNWEDLRVVDEQKEGRSRFPVQWCHGAPGVIINRLQLRKYWADERMDEEIRIGIATTLANWRSKSHCMCHGDLGNLDVLLYAAVQLQDPPLEKHVSKLAAQSLQEAEAKGWYCGVPAELDAPGMMVGVSGIGYAMLRFANPSIPSLLALEAPVHSMARKGGSF